MPDPTPPAASTPPSQQPAPSSPAPVSPEQQPTPQLSTTPPSSPPAPTVPAPAAEVSPVTPPPQQPSPPTIPPVPPICAPSVPLPFPIKKLVIAFVLGMVLTGVTFVAVSRMFTDEDTWICQDGKWVKHGNPVAPMPLGKCGVVPGASASAKSISSPAGKSSGASTSSAQAKTSTSSAVSSKAASQAASAVSSSISKASSASAATSSASAGGTEKTFTASDFSITYPAWPVIPAGSILAPDQTKVAVTKNGCALIVTVLPLPEGEQFQSFMENLITEQVQSTGVTVTLKEVKETTMRLSGEFPVSGRTALTTQYGFLTPNNNFYSIVFASEKSQYDKVCKPVVDGIIKSVKVQ